MDIQAKSKLLKKHTIHDRHTIAFAYCIKPPPPACIIPGCMGCCCCPCTTTNSLSVAIIDRSSGQFAYLHLVKPLLLLHLRLLLVAIPLLHHVRVRLRIAHRPLLRMRRQRQRRIHLPDNPAREQSMEAQTQRKG